MNSHPPSPFRFSPAALIVIVLLFAAITFTRFYRLEVRPMHNDEGVNAWFLTNLIKKPSSYHYDPNNYHGPILYYLQLPVIWLNGLRVDGVKEFSFKKISGMNDYSVRVTTVLFSLMLLIGIILSRFRIGELGVLFALVLAGTSSSLLYFSRYFIHEIYFVGFTLGLYLCLAAYRDTAKSSFLGWAGVFAAFIFCTKETSIIIYTVLILSIICTEFSYAFLHQWKSPSWRIQSKNEFAWFFQKVFVENWQIIYMGIILWAIFYSSFGSYPRGMLDSFLTYAKWTKEGMESGHNKPFPYFFTDMLYPTDFAVLFCSLVGLVMAFLAKDKKGLFLAFWTLGICSVHALIPYKTPWLIVNLLVPMILLSGYGFQKVFDLLFSRDPPFAYRWHVAGAIIVGFGVLNWFQWKITQKINYVEYDTEVYPQPYVHTSRDIYNLVHRIDELAEQCGLGKDIKINVVSKVYWPLPYYLRNYKTANFWGQYENVGVLDSPLLIAQNTQAEALKSLLKSEYVIEEYTLWSDTYLQLYINKKILKHYDPIPKLTNLKLTPLLSSASLNQGLVKRIYRGRRFDGAPVGEMQGLQEPTLSVLNEEDKPFPSPFSMIWKGYLKIEKEADITFSTESDDGSWLYLNGSMVIDNGGAHAQRKISNTLHMAEGFYRVEIRYFDVGGGAVMNLFWKYPSMGESRIPASAFYYSVDDLLPS